MSSPRKYSSPYLTSIPGLSTTPPNPKAKRRSKTSIKLNESTVQVGQTDKPTTSSHVLKHRPSYEASCGDVDSKIMNDLKESSKPVELSHKVENHQGENECLGGATASGVNSKNDPSPNGTDDHHHDQQEETSYYEHYSSDLADECQPRPSCSTNNNVNASDLKSILKKPNPYKDKAKVKFENETSNKKPSVNSSKGKYGKPTKDAKDVKDNNSSRLTRSPSKPKASSRSVSKLDMQRGTPLMATKSPRKVKAVSQSKTEEKAGPSAIVPTKSVRFSNRVDVYTVPYESRAGTRACDWQRNMLEQRMQNFRQLMKEVNTDEIDFMGGSMLFPGFPYHVPNPNFALRGRGVRSSFSNFKL